MTRTDIYNAIDAERVRQAELWNKDHDWGWGDCSSAALPTPVKVAVLTEEVGEVARAALTPIQRNTADNLAAKLMSISNSLAAAGELGAKTAHRLNALANSEVGKIDDSDPLGSRENLQGVAVLTKLANDSASIALNLLAANKATVEQMNNEKPPEEEPPLRPQISRDEWLKLHGHA